MKTNSMQNSVWASVGNSVRYSVWASVWNPVEDSVRHSINKLNEKQFFKKLR